MIKEQSVRLFYSYKCLALNPMRTNHNHFLKTVESWVLNILKKRRTKKILGEFYKVYIYN